MPSSSSSSSLVASTTSLLLVLCFASWLVQAQFPQSQVISRVGTWTIPKREGGVSLAPLVFNQTEFEGNVVRVSAEFIDVKLASSLENVTSFNFNYTTSYSNATSGQRIEGPLSVFRVSNVTAPWKPVTLFDAQTPCVPLIAKLDGGQLRVLPVFWTTANISVTVNVTAEVFDSLLPNENHTDVDWLITVPTSPVEVFTLFPQTRVEIQVTLRNLDNATRPINSLFQTLSVGCSDVIDLKGIKESEYTVSGVYEPNSTPFVISLSTIPGQALSPDFEIVISTTAAPAKSSDDGLKGWEIAIIVVFSVLGAVLVLGIIIAVAIFLLRKKRWEYHDLDHS